jgi:transglutaminase superfamily protein
MSAYRLPNHIHFCEIGGQRVFLDLAGDRYFCLPPQAETAFGLLLADASPAAPIASDIDLLIRSGVVIAAPSGRPLAATRHVRPTQSLFERGGGGRALAIAAFAETWILVLRARRAVAGKKLPSLLASLAARRPRCEAGSAADRDRATASFRAARRLVPIAPNCLYDSIALCRFLQRRGVAADLVIGAKLHPFGAHCWLQDGPIVLNDSLAAAREFEPVLVT